MDTAATRVVDAQRQAGATLRLALLLALAAAAVAASGAGDGPWLALHLFLVGGVLSAISGATQLFAVTWSAAPAPSNAVVAGQRWCIAGGAVAVGVGRQASVDELAVAGAVGVLAGLGLLARSLVTIRRQGRNVRFRPAIDTYLMAIGCAGVGVAMGAWMVVAEPSAAWLDVRAAHVTLNLFGLVGLVIVGTLPTFVATQLRARMHRRATPGRQRLVGIVVAVGVAVTAAGQLGGQAGVAGVGRTAMLAGWLGVVGLLPAVSRRQLGWAGPRAVQLASGIAWWIAVVGALVTSDLRGRSPGTDVLAALAVGGVAQILVASLAYLAPVVRAGGHERLRAGFTATRSWSSVVAGNLAAVLLLAGAHGAAASVLVVWAAEVAVRSVRLRGRPAPAAPAAPGAPAEVPGP